MFSQMQIIFFLLAALFAFLFLIFIYYLYNEQLSNNKYQGDEAALAADQDKLSPEYSQMAVSNVNINKTNDASSLPSQAPAQSSQSSQSAQSAQSAQQAQQAQQPKTKQVYNISENKFTAKEAKAACKAFGGELASIEQLVDAYRKGADWCNYGWIEGQMAFYPTQKSTWDILQKNSTAEKRNVCGKPGLNGGYFNNPDLRFGVNCYGIKPEPRGKERVKQTLVSDEDAELNAMVTQFKRELDNITLLPFNRDDWTGCGK